MNRRPRHRRTRAGGLAAGLAGALSLAMLGAVVVVPATAAAADVVTVSSDALRTSWDGDEAGLTAQPVSSDGFGELFATTLDGQIYAQPVIADNTLVAVTENDNVYGLDPVTGAIRWQRSVGTPWPTRPTVTCDDLVPNAGITSTPVVDSNGIVYFTAKTWNGTDNSSVAWSMHAIDAETGTEQPGWPIAISGAPTNDPTHPFQPVMQLQRSGLLLMGGVVYAAFASHCDNQPTRGYVVGVRSGATPALQTMWTSAPTDPVDGQSGIWMSGSGIMSDGAGRMFVATGNGDAPPYGAAASGLTAFGDSVVRLDVQPNGSLAPADYFTPAGASQLETGDKDFGSGGIVGLPDVFGTPSHPHLAVVAGKDGRFFLLDRDQLGGRAHEDSDPGALGVYGPYHGQFSHVAAWPSDGGWLYTTDLNGPLRAWHAGADAAGNPVLTIAGTSAETMPFGSGSPVVTSNGDDGSDALVWIVRGSPTPATIGTLEAYDAEPGADGTLALRWSAPIGFAGKFTVPATDSGRIYVGTRGDNTTGAGVLYGFGRTSELAADGQSWSAGGVAVGQHKVGSVTVAVPANGSAMRVVGATATGAFAVDSAGLPSEPVAPGASAVVPVTFSPTSGGPQRGTVRFQLRPAANPAAPLSTVTVDVAGSGVPTGLVATPASVDLGTAAMGSPSTAAVSFGNAGTTPLSLTGLTATGGYQVIGAPALPASIPAGGRIAVRVSVVPTAVGVVAGTLTATAGGVPVSVPLTASATLPLGRLAIETTPLALGDVTVGKPAKVVLTMTNIGRGPMTITNAAMDGGSEWQATGDLVGGRKLRSDDVATETITFTPRGPGPQTAKFIWGADTSSRAQQFVVTAYARGALPTFSQGLWRASGRAGVRQGVATLTPLSANAAGMLGYTRQVRTTGLHASFQAYLGGGHAPGGAGLTFAVLPAYPGATGSSGAGMGVGGLASVAVALDTEKDRGDPSANFVGVLTSRLHGGMTYVATAPMRTSLRGAWHTVDVRESYGRLIVGIDGHRVLSVAVRLPSLGYLAFTAGTGRTPDVQAVRYPNVSVN